VNLHSDGGFILVGTTWFSPLCSIDLGETMSLSQTMHSVVELGFDDMNFSLDSKIAIDAFNGGDKYLSIYLQLRG